MSKNELRQQRRAPKERFCEWRGLNCPIQPQFFLYFVPHFPNFFGAFHLDFSPSQ